MNKREFVASMAACLAALIAGPVSAQAPAWPTKPVKFVVSWPAGGGADSVARIVAERLSASLGQQVIVENRPGAGGKIGTLSVVRSEPDGYTLLFAAPSELSIAAATVQQLQYDPIKDLQPVSQVMRGPYILVAHPSFPPNSLSELIAYAKANPGKVNYSSFGQNTLNHLYGELLNVNAGINVTHVAYKGSTPALTDLVAGQVQYMFDNAATVWPHVKAGKLKAIAVMAPERLSIAPAVPTMTESGMPNFGTGTWLGVLAPAKTPKAVVDKLHAELTATLKTPELGKVFEDRSIQPVGNSPGEFSRLIQSEIAQWKALAAKAGLKLE
jgi:tripartite-type tricarboxylate transporter receptor subunit TctC